MRDVLERLDSKLDTTEENLEAWNVEIHIYLQSSIERQL